MAAADICDVARACNTPTYQTHGEDCEEVLVDFCCREEDDCPGPEVTAADVEQCAEALGQQTCPQADEGAPAACFWIGDTWED